MPTLPYLHLLLLIALLWLGFVIPSNSPAEGLSELGYILVCDGNAPTSGNGPDEKPGCTAQGLTRPFGALRTTAAAPPCARPSSAAFSNTAIRAPPAQPV